MDNNTSHNEVTPQVNQIDAHVAGEIDLLDIMRILMHQKTLIIGIIVLCTALAVGVALLLPREYEAELIMLPSLAETVEKLNVPGIGKSVSVIDQSSPKYFFEVDSQKLYSDLIENLQSIELQRQFFDENEMVRFLSVEDGDQPAEQIFLEKFSDKLVVKGIKGYKIDMKKSGFISIILEGRNPDQISDWLNRFVDLADQETIKSQVKSFSMKTQRLRSTISERIESLRTTEKSRRLDLIEQFKEAVVIADAIGLTEQVNISLAPYDKLVEKMGLTSNPAETPLYLRGSNALRAELKMLKERKNDDPFIPDLRGLQEDMNFLSSLKQDVDGVHAMRVDLRAVPDSRSVKPKRKLIVILGFIVGFFLAVFMAFVRHVVVTEKQSNVS